MPKPIIAIALGDPDGIGPEVIVKVLSEEETCTQCRPLVVGDVGVLEAIGAVLGSALRFAEIGAVSEARFERGVVEVLRPEGLRRRPPQWGRLDAANGEAAARGIAEALALAQRGQVQGLILAPMNKQAFHLAGYSHHDELEYMAALTHATDAYIMGIVGELWTVTVAEHVAFRDILPLIRRERILPRIRAMHDTLVRVGRNRPRIAVAALNVHAGEGGTIGREEIDEIGPAVQQAAQEGIDAHGPFPADTVFVTALDQGFDGVVCMHHDQANIARKLLAKWSGATLYMGLPAPAATTAHGTAFDIAGKGIADPGSMMAALRNTARLAAGHSS